LFLVAFSFGGAQEKTTSPAALGSLNKIYQPFLGKWTDSLQSDERVNPPTWLEVNPSVDGKSREFRRTWDDGPNRFVKELSRIHIAPQKKTFFGSRQERGRLPNALHPPVAEFSNQGGQAPRTMKKLKFTPA
jgi:hypothetical protein